MTSFFQSLGRNYEGAWFAATLSGILLIALPLMLAVAMIIYADRKISWTKRLGRHFRETAGFPPPTVWLWGERPSILAGVFARAFFFARCLSPLQHVKQIHRVRKARFAAALPDGAKARPDFEARDTETYYLVALLCISANYALFFVLSHYGATFLAPCLHAALFAVTGLVRAFSILIALVLALETFVWISYYLLWRSFAEPVYTLYHPAEYFVLFPVILVVQTVSLAVLLESPPVRVFLALVDVAEKPEWLAALGKFYFVVIIANLLSMFPQTRFKAPTVINIIGAGDVVANRMLPALLHSASATTSAHIQVFSIGEEDDLSAKIRATGTALDISPHSSDVAQSQGAIVAKIVASGAPAIIATPSDAHFKYVTALNGKGIKFAVEKPLSTLAQEIKIFAETSGTFKDRMFALSYYGLEKALPLNYLLTANRHFEAFLAISGAGALSQKAVSLHIDAPILLSRLGKLRSVQIDLIEGSEHSPRGGRRSWTEQHGTQGLAFETMIHPLICLQKLLRQQCIAIAQFMPTTVAGYYQEEGNTKDSATFLRYEGVIGTEAQLVAVALTCGKYADAPNVRRAGEADFDNGSLLFDFDEQSCTIRMDDGAETHICVAKRWSSKYAVQMTLVRKFFQEGWVDIRFDDFDDQIEVLNWLSASEHAPQATFEYGQEIGFDGLAASIRKPAPLLPERRRGDRGWLSRLRSLFD